MKFVRYLRLRKSYLIFGFLILALLIIGFFSGSYLTGKIIVKNCQEVKICVNKTIRVCDESIFREACSEKCFNETVIVCEEICHEVDNKTFCERVCEDVEEEVCREVCDYPDNVSIENCVDKIVPSCSFDSVCENG